MRSCQVALIVKTKHLSEPCDEPHTCIESNRWHLEPESSVLLSVTPLILTLLSSLKQALCSYKAVYVCLSL